jgi:hypothetical protein
MMPRGRAMISATTVAANTRLRVMGTRSFKFSLTDVWRMYESPRSPVAAWLTHRQYCERSGSLRCSSSRFWAIASNVAFSPPAAATAGSVGTSFTSRNTPKVTMKSVGMTIRSRRTISPSIASHPSPGASPRAAWWVSVGSARSFRQRGR